MMHVCYEDDFEWDRIEVCGIRRADDFECRLHKGHDGDHIPFSQELIVASGVKICGLERGML